MLARCFTATLERTNMEQNMNVINRVALGLGMTRTLMIL